MARTRDAVSAVWSRPYLGAYLVALVVVWVVTAATWSVGPEGSIDIAPLAQALQYLVVILASVLAAIRVRVHAPDDSTLSAFRWYDHEWTIRQDVGGTSLWTSIGVGIVAMTVNVALLVMADAFVSGSVEIGQVLQWFGAGIAAGAVLGIIGAVIAFVVSSLLASLRRGPGR